MRAAFLLKDRSGQELLEGVFAAVTREFEDVAVVVAHIAEMDIRKLFPGEGCSSMKTYCMEVLRLTEDQAYSRIAVARTAQKFPVVLDMIADGLVHLTAVDRLGPSLTEENYLCILAEATHKSMAEVEEIVARLRPKPAVPSSIYKVGCDPEHGNEEDMFQDNGESAPDKEVPDEHVPATRPRKPRISPLGPGSHDVHFTADDELMYALRELQELLSHQVPSADPAVIIKHSLLRTLKDVKKERFGTGKRRKKAEAASVTEVSREGISAATAGKEFEEGTDKYPKDVAVETTKDGTQSRYIPKAIQKEVWERDGGRCAFRSERGKWCTARRFLEFHHIIPFAWRGPTTVDNLELRCRTHNGYEGELLFGKIISKRDPRWHQLKARTGFKTSATPTVTTVELPKDAWRGRTGSQ